MVYTMAVGAVAAGVCGLVIVLPILLYIMLHCEAYAPQRLEISEECLTILRRRDSITILHSTILEIAPLTKQDMAWTITMGGCGGLFGYFGSYKNRKLGSFRMYATSRENLFVIRTADGRQIVINCAEPELLQKNGYSC